MAADSRRLSILSPQEVDELYGLPRFAENDRRLYFDLGPAERELVDGVFTFSVAVHLVLQLGYFKAKRQFFVYSLDSVMEDVAYIVRQHFRARDEGEVKVPSRSTRLEQQQIILKLFDYRLCDAAAKGELELKAQRAAMLSAHRTDGEGLVSFSLAGFAASLSVVRKQEQPDTQEPRLMELRFSFISDS